MEREDGRALLDPGHPGALHLAHAAVAVREGESEAAGQRGERLVDLEAGVQLPTIGEQLRPAADAGPSRPDEELLGGRGVNLHALDLDAAGGDEPERASLHALAVPLMACIEPRDCGET